MIPLQYALASRDEQEAVARRIAELRLLRFLADLGEDPRDERQVAVQAATKASVAELRRLEAPFYPQHSSDEPNWPMPAELSLAEFLRQFDGTPALVGDICLVQGDARVAAFLVQPILGLDGLQFQRRTDWLTKLRTVEHGEFRGAEIAIRAFHSELHERCGALLATQGAADDQDGAEEGTALLVAISDVCTRRLDVFTGGRDDRYLPYPGNPPLFTSIAGTVVPVSWVRPVAGVARAVLGPLRRLLGRKSGRSDAPSSGYRPVR